jgi:tRNA U34 2-thiouridine synthase MnmA/TrmU
MQLAVAEKGESFEICFVPNGDYAAFMERLSAAEGRARDAHARARS